VQIILTLSDTQQPIFPEESLTPRAKGLLEQYIKERFFDALLYQSEVQKDFSNWLEAYQEKSTAANKTKRGVIRQLRSAAEASPFTETLAEEMDRLNFDARNNVPNKQINFELSHLIDTAFLNKMAMLAQNQEVPVIERKGLMLFAATLMVGLRTSEWQTAELVKDNPARQPGETTAHPYLVVQTAKSRKTDPEPRLMMLEGFDEGALQMIQTCLNFMREVNKGYISQIVSRMRVALLKICAGDAELFELAKHIDMRTARKIYTVEARRAGRTPEQVAAGLGHTTTNNLRWYAQGDIKCARKTNIPLARAPHKAVQAIRDPLAELNERKMLAGEKNINGYPDLTAPDAPGHQSFMERLTSAASTLNNDSGDPSDQ